MNRQRRDRSWRRRRLRGTRRDADTGGQAEQQRDREQMAHDGFLLIVMVAAWYDSRPWSPLPDLPRRRFAPICRIAEALLEMIDEQACAPRQVAARSEEHPSELQTLMSTSYAGFCLKKTKTHTDKTI